jgi:hypothetical protein
MDDLKPHPPPARSDISHTRTDSSDALVTDGFIVPDIEPSSDAPPAYGELRDQMQFSQPGFEAGAAVTGWFSCSCS